MLRQFEDNNFRNNWTIQHLNALAEERNGSGQCLIPRRRDRFRAGAPPLNARELAYDPYEDYFTCSTCDEDYESECELKQHLKEGE